VKLRYFTGLSRQEAAETLGISRGAADRLWALAWAWLFGWPAHWAICQGVTVSGFGVSGCRVVHRRSDTPVPWCWKARLQTHRGQGGGAAQLG
jgi:hypothetical protein